MITDERDSRQKCIEDIAGRMMAAGRTAPKAKGVDIMEIITLTGDDLHKLAVKMREVAEETGLKFLIRDAENVMQSGAVVVAGVPVKTMNLNCGYCGYSTCARKEPHEEVPCVMNSVDLGIAIGSMVSVAADMRADARVMFSVGLAAKRMGLLEGCRSVFGIPVSISSKSPYFDRVFNH